MKVICLKFFAFLFSLVAWPMRIVMAAMPLKPLELKQVPSYVMLKNSLEDTIAICGGSLITLSTVITAAECLADRVNRRSTFFGFVVVGTTSQSKCEDLCQHQTVKDLVVHGQFYYARESPDNLGLIETSFPFQQTEAVAPASLHAWTLSPGTRVDIVGVSKDSDDDIVQQGQTIVIDSSLCSSRRGKTMYMCVDPENFDIGSPVLEGETGLAGIVISNSGDEDEKTIVLNLLHYHYYISRVKGGLRTLKSPTSINFARNRLFKVTADVILVSLVIFHGM